MSYTHNARVSVARVSVARVSVARVSVARVIGRIKIENEENNFLATPAQTRYKCFPGKLRVVYVKKYHQLLLSQLLLLSVWFLLKPNWNTGPATGVWRQFD